MNEKNRRVFTILKSGGVLVLPTDTLYGVCALALNEKAVRRVYAIKKRTPTKPFIILISSLTDLAQFGIRLTESQRLFCKRVWPNKVSIVLPCPAKKFSYLHRGTKTLAFRLPKSLRLRALLRKTGPLVAPSANPEGLKPATTITQARVYFGDAVDFYMRGRVSPNASTLVEVKGDKVVVLRQGAVSIPQVLK